jgi:hypothetical protein
VIVHHLGERGEPYAVGANTFDGVNTERDEGKGFLVFVSVIVNSDHLSGLRDASADTVPALPGT